MQDAFVARDRRRDQEVKLKPARTTIATQQSQLTDTLDRRATPRSPILGRRRLHETE